MRRLFALASLSLIGLVSAVPAFAAGSSPQPEKAVNWQQRDTAVYVVSTLNLLHSPTGRPLIKRMNAARYEVYGDLDRSDLYFIQLRKGGLTTGTLAYQMGWKLPQSISGLPVRLGIHQASEDIKTAYRSDDKALIGSFNSTMPGY